MRRLIVGSLVLAVPALLPLTACGSSGDGGGNGGAPFGGSGGVAGSGATAGSGASGGAAGSGASGGIGASGGNGAGGSGAGGSGAGGSGAGGSGAGGSGGTVVDSGIPDVTFTYDAPIIVEDACAATRIEAEPIPLDMYIALDDSGSMGSDCNVGSGTNSKWCYAVNALDGFFNAPTSVGMGVALNYINNRNGCVGLNAPPVGLDTLPNHLTALRNSLNAAGPTGITPIEAALRGIASYTVANRRAGRQMIGILITDGAPQTCSSNDTTLRDIARDLYNNHGIPTFMVGMTGANYTRLETWASLSGGAVHTNFCGGGMASCRHYDVGNGNPAAFIDALQQIQASAIGCTFSLPQPDSGLLDLDGISVIYTPGGGSAETLVRVTDESQCGTAGGRGWYADSNTAPTQINLCPNLCDVVKADDSAQIDVEVACQGS
ncbi:MAG: hypothetical protein KIT72_09770 [Polyangiaceae bacterium]|nr:hypothetical protein [Polyangiaceae bacterium]MCW5790696.1 hypothetical protein [Polyangiaceae bacterium]